MNPCPPPQVVLWGTGFLRNSERVCENDPAAGYDRKSGGGGSETVGTMTVWERMVCLGWLVVVELGWMAWYRRR